MHLDFLSIPHSGARNVEPFGWDHRLQRKNLFMTFDEVVCYFANHENRESD